MSVLNSTKRFNPDGSPIRTPKKRASFTNDDIQNLINTPQFDMPIEKKQVHKFTFKKADLKLKDSDATKIDRLIFHIKKLASLHLETLGNKNKQVRDLCQIAYRSFFHSFRDWILSGNMEIQKIIFNEILPIDELKNRQLKVSETLCDLQHELKVWHKIQFKPPRLYFPGYYSNLSLPPIVPYDIDAPIERLTEALDQIIQNIQMHKSSFHQLNYLVIQNQEHFRTHLHIDFHHQQTIISIGKKI